MEEWEKELITNNFDTLINTTTCNATFLASLMASGILHVEDINDLNVQSNHPTKQASIFYNLIVRRVRGFQMLLKALNKTNQSGALSILTNMPLKYDNSFRYDENAKLGKGKFASVFKGEYEGRSVAVKRLFQTNEDERIRIQNEVDIFKICGLHPNIVHFFTSRSSQFFVLIVLDLCDMTLKQWIRDKNIKITHREVLRQVTVGLAWLHEQCILYRGIIPENILLKRRPTGVKISGFGLSSKVMEGGNCVKLSASEVAETLEWDAPEVTEAQNNNEKSNKPKITFAADVYSLGCMFFYVLTEGLNNFEDLKNLEDLEIKNEACAHDVRIMKRMICENPASRPCISEVLSSPTLRSENTNYTAAPILELLESTKTKVAGLVPLMNEIYNVLCIPFVILDKAIGVLLILLYVLLLGIYLGSESAADT